MSGFTPMVPHTPVYSSDVYAYTASYICQQLNLQDQALANLTNLLTLSPQANPTTGELAYTAQQLELLRKAVELYSQGQSLQAIVQLLGTSQGTPSTQATALSSPASTTTIAATTPVADSSVASSNLNAIVEAISTSKEGILSEISRLLDDRLAGLDEVVIELIRTKSENDSLRQRMNSLMKERDQLQESLNCFKPVQFGFYKKVEK
ncbi:MAG: hypothetical protein ACKO34_01700 [Vampirovibrionales bacterium]